jgi:hypothetical protein
MKALVLGAAAGGGFPLWNSNAEVCRRARAGDPHAVPRTQAMASFALRFWLRSKWIATSIIMSRKCPSAVDKRHSMCTAKLRHRIRRERAVGTEKKTRRPGGAAAGAAGSSGDGGNERRAGIGHGFAAVVADLLQGSPSMRASAFGVPQCPGSFSHLPARTLMRRHWCGAFSYSSVWHRGIR